MINWIKYPENKPDEADYYLVWDSSIKDWDVDYYDGKRFIDDEIITHFATVTPPTEQSV